MALAAFRCSTFDAPWSLEVQEAIRNELPDAIANGICEAEGLWVANELAALISWRPNRDPAIRAKYGDKVWHVAELAVSVDHRGQRFASLLKRWLVNEAHASGIRYVVSLVHWDNRIMFDMNKRLGGSIAQVMDGPFKIDEIYGRCIVPVKPWPLS